MKKASLSILGPRQIHIDETPVSPPGPGQVLVQAELSAISAGTELLAYRGETPAGTNATCDADGGSRCGYSMVGRVIQLGPGVDPGWAERRVFAFQPHGSHFLTQPNDLLILPDHVETDDAVFLPNMETAVNLVQDGQPLVGERVAVFGLGIVGLLTTSLLSRFPLDQLVVVDPLPARRAAAIQMGAANTEPAPGHFDLCFEISGHPETLNHAIAATAFSGRIVIGSWYGNKRAEIDLGGSFHRSRIRILSSQVSTLSPALAGTWTKSRRLEVALGLLQQVRPSSLITQRFPLSQAAQAFQLLDRSPQEAIQVVLIYP